LFLATGVVRGVTAENAPAIEVGLLIRGRRGLGKKSHCGPPLSALVAVCALAGCADVGKIGTVDPRFGVSSGARLFALGDPIPKGGGTYRVGSPYSIGGRNYVPAEDPHYRAEGLASWYGEDFHGRQTANGEIYDMNSVSAAHATLPMPTYVRVTNLTNNRSVIVRVNDRGPYHADRIIDVSVKTAVLLGFYSGGVAPVRVEYVGTAPLEGSDDRTLIATLREGEPAPAPSLVRVATKPFMPRNVPMPVQRPYSLGEEQAVLDAQPGSGVPQIARASAADRSNKSVSANAGTAPLRPAASAYAPVLSEMHNGDPAPPFLIPATNLRSSY
jgi:rare lipoprotein A